MTELAGWQNFYVIAGSSAGALIGLQFVMLTLIANRPVVRTGPETGATFGTPTVVHFCAVLGLSGMLSAPWHSARAVAILLGLVGAAGVVYGAIVVRRIRAQTSYRPEFEDWLFHALLPIVAYATLGGSGWAAAYRLREALFAVAGAVLLLLYIGIHNAWDAVTYHVFVVRRRESERRAE